MTRLALSSCFALLITGNVSASELPHFNIEATCRAAPSLQGGIQDPFPSCVSDEENARAQLQEIWKTYNAQHRTECVNLTRLDDSPSYVEVLTCLQMYAADASPKPLPGQRR
jgi:hypothetical protein